MNQQSSAQSKGTSLLPWFLGSAICFLGYIAICLLSGANFVSMLSFFICVPFYLVFPGMLFAQLFDIPNLGLTPLLSILYGTGFFAALVCFSVRLQLVWILQIVPPILSLLFLWQWFNKQKTLQNNTIKSIFHNKIFACFIVFSSILCLLFGLFHSAENAHPLAAGTINLSRDLLWNIGNGNAFTHAFPPQDIRFVGVRFSYHYLTELIVGGLSLVSGASSYDIFVFFSGPVFIAVQLIALYCLGRCFYQDNRKKSLLLPIVLFGFQCASMWGIFSQQESVFSNTMLKHLITNINAQATACIFLCIFTVLFTILARQKFKANWKLFAAYFASFLLLAVAKGPQAALVLCSLVVTMVFVLLFQKPNYLGALLCLVGTTGLFALIYSILFSSGANSSMTFSIFSMENSLAYQTLSPLADWLCAHLPISGYVWLICIGIINAFCMIPFQFSLWLRGLPHTIRHLFHLDAGHIFANGIVAGGFLAYHLFWHPNSSQAYFALAAIFFITLLAVEQLPSLKNFKKISFYPIAICGIIGLITTACMVVTYGGNGFKQLLSTIGILPPQISANNVLAEDEQAMVWLAKNTDNQIVFSTNRTSSNPNELDGISNVYSALSGRQGYMEGWTYAVSNMGVSQEIVSHRQSVTEQLFSGTLSQESFQLLCNQEGINCLIYSKNYSGIMPDYLSPAFENSAVSIYLLNNESK